MLPRVSVVVPLYNKARYVGRALDSIAKQTFEDFEVIVVDDGSTDTGSTFAASYPDPRFRLIGQPRQGPGAARNRGLSLATGEFVAFLDADDEWLPDYLEQAVRQLTDGGTACVCGYFDEPGGVSTIDLWRRRGIRTGPFRANAHTPKSVFLHMAAYLTPCTLVARTAMLRRWGGFYDVNKCIYGEDTFLWLKVLVNETIVVDLNPRVRLHREASELSNNLRGPRPLEPFLSHPDEVLRDCPPDLQPLLHSFCTIRAFKSACILAYWGHWQDAKALRERFRSQSDYRLPYYWPSLVCSTPAGGALAGLWRRMRS
jgi:glycosyltransferase involved in cell wall biosynthesis